MKSYTTTADDNVEDQKNRCSIYYVFFSRYWKFSFLFCDCTFNDFSSFHNLTVSLQSIRLKTETPVNLLDLSQIDKFNSKTTLNFDKSSFLFFIFFDISLIYLSESIFLHLLHLTLSIFNYNLWNKIYAILKLDSSHSLHLFFFSLGIQDCELEIKIR